MSGLFRSEDMSYISLTMASDTCQATIAAVARLNAFHLVDLSPHHSAAPGAGLTGAVDPNAASSQSSTAREHKYYKRRLAQCILWQKTLERYKSIRDESYPRVPPLPCVRGGDIIHESDLQYVDLVESLENMWNPIEEDLVMNTNYLKQAELELRALRERRSVIALMSELDLNDEVAKLHRQIMSQGEQTRTSFSRSVFSHNNNSGGSSEIPMSEKPARLHESHPTRFIIPASERFKSFVCGVLPATSQVSLGRMLYRMTRGNSLLRCAPIPPTSLKTPSKKNEPDMLVFYIIYLGQHLAGRVKKLVEVEGGRLYDLPQADELVQAAKEANAADTAHSSSSYGKLDEEHKNGDHDGNGKATSSTGVSRLSNDTDFYEVEVRALDKSIADQIVVLQSTANQIQSLLMKVFRETDKQGRETCPLLDWMTAVKHEIVVCQAMQLAHYYQSLVALEGWAPTRLVPALQLSVKEAVRGSGAPPAMLEVNPVSTLRSIGTPPTSFPLTKFTSTFQGIVDTYGVPRYKEVNPGLFTIITFPFLFGIMYGDIGHGLILFFASVWLIYYESYFEKTRARGQLNEILSMVYDGRYMLLLMSMFAVYVGTVYNDVFCLPTSVFDSGYQKIGPSAPNDYELASRPYPYGLDPVWGFKSNELTFYNSFKMKMSVILGVTQMAFGIALSLANHLYFGDYVSAWFEFIPRMVFLLALFGYMDFMIIYKWCIDWSHPDARPAPNLIQTMIKMFLSPGTIEDGHLLYEGQGLVQAILVVAAVISVPIMLCVKPCWHNHLHKQVAASRGRTESALHHGKDGSMPTPMDGLFPHDVPLVEHNQQQTPQQPNSPTIQSPTPKKLQLKNSSDSTDGNVELQALGNDGTHPHTPSGPTTASSSPANDIELPLIHPASSTQPASTTGSKLPTPTNADDQPANTRKSGALTLDVDPQPVRQVSHISNPPSPTVTHPLASPVGADHAEVNPVLTTGSDDEHVAEFNFSDEMIHQSIHTIEFVLGTVSNTASYLRLWALSLAHQQLSTVFWNKMMLQYGVANDSVALSFIGYGVWAIATFAVLLCMDVLECFLHALRLHWVEFQNKFYYADGKPFQPMTFDVKDEST